MDELGTVLHVELEQHNTRMFNSASCTETTLNPIIVGL